MDDLLNKAKKILEKNWYGNATKPAPRLYPHQWSWDSAFIAIGYSHYDQNRAQQELLSLFKGQWKNGMLPHILFRPRFPRYFPGPSFWEIERSPDAPEDVKTSGIIQPPVHATAALAIYKNASDKREAKKFLKGIFPKIKRFHEYLYKFRDPEGESLIALAHPWGSGLDNAPIWDEPLKKIKPRKKELPDYKRVDIEKIPREERPTDEDYERYLYLVKLFKDWNYDPNQTLEHSPFLIQDVLFNSILCRGNRDLAEIAKILDEDPSPMKNWAMSTKEAVNKKLWNEKKAIYFDYDLRAKKQIPVQVASGFLPLYGGIPSRERALKLYDHLNSNCFCQIGEKCYAIPSYDKHGEAFTRIQYWRGPIWININWMLYHGLREYGFNEYADYIRSAIIELPKNFGFYEYFDPEKGAGHGSKNFSWTASLLIDILLEDGN